MDEHEKLHARMWKAAYRIDTDCGYPFRGEPRDTLDEEIVITEMLKECALAHSHKDDYETLVRCAALMDTIEAKLAAIGL